MEKKGFKRGSNTVYKTVYLNGEEVGAGEGPGDRNVDDAVVASDGQMDEEHRKVLIEHVYYLREELDKRERESGGYHAENVKRIKEVTEKNQKLEKVQCELNKEYFLQRAKFEELEQKLNEENQLLRLKNVSISKELDDLRQRAQQEIHINKELADKKSEEYTHKYKNQVRMKEDTLQVVKDQYSKVQHIYIAKIKTLEEALGGLKSRYED